MQFVVSFGNVVNGWSLNWRLPESFGDDFWFRATRNFGGIWWNSSNEAVYEMLHTDAAGHDPTGATAYTMRFETSKRPTPLRMRSGRSPSTASRTTCSLPTRSAATT